MIRRGETSLARTAGSWCDQWSLPYESAFGRLQKYKWLNAASNSDLAYDLGLASWCRPAYDLLNGNWVRLDRRGFPAELKICTTLTAHYGSRWPRALSSAESLRYCPPCMELGYHSIFFQFDFLARCPIHDCPLIGECQCCGKPTSALALFPELNKKRDLERDYTVFKCEACEGALIGAINPDKWFPPPATRNSMRRMFTPIHDWLRRLEKEYPSFLSHQLPLNHIGLVATKASESVRSALAHFAMFAVPLELPARLISQRRRPLSYHRIVCESSAKVELGASLSAIHRKVAKYLLKTHLLPHRKCIPLALPSLAYRRYKHHEHVFPYAVRCTLAMAYVHWEFNCTYRNLVADHYLYQDLRDVTNAKIHYIDVLAEFYSTLVAIVAFTKRPPVSARSFAYYEELQQHFEFPRFGECTWCLMRHVQDQESDTPSCVVASVDASVMKILRKEKLLSCDLGEGSNAPILDGRELFQRPDVLVGPQIASPRRARSKAR
jgi:hypothetical protein